MRLTIEDIGSLLRPSGSDATSVLKRRLLELSDEIKRLREHQHAIFRLLQKRDVIGRLKVVTKQKWVSIMKSAGFSKDAMERWHHEFEKSAPNEHQEFLEFLHIDPEEIKVIRAESRK